MVEEESLEMHLLGALVCMQPRLHALNAADAWQSAGFSCRLFVAV